MKKVILVVEDDEIFRETVLAVLEDLDVTLLSAGNGEEAKEILKSEETVDLVITDVQMPKMSGVELIEWSRTVYDTSYRQNQELPFILMTGFAHIIETQKAHNLGIKKFLAKPFEEDELIRAVGNELGIKTGLKEEENKTEKTYCKVSLEDFVTEKNMEMDVYIKLSEEKYVKIAHKGGKIPKVQLDNYLKKGITFLYILKSEFSKVLNFNVKLGNAVAKSEKVPIEKKRRFISNTADVLLENVFVNGLDESSFRESKEFITNTLDVVLEDKEIFSMIEILNGHTDYLYSHSLGVSIYSVMIAKALGYRRASTHFHLSLGGLLHDIGKKELDPTLLKKSRVELSYAERSLLETHAARGKEILEGIKSIPSDVVAIAYEHHEDCLGQGYPRQLPKERIHPLARITSIADAFCNYALKSYHNEGMSAKNAVKLIEQHKLDMLDPVLFKGLKSIIVDEENSAEQMVA